MSSFGLKIKYRNKINFFLSVEKILTSSETTKGDIPFYKSFNLSTFLYKSVILNYCLKE